MRKILSTRRDVLLGFLAGSAILARPGWAAPLDDVLAVPAVDLHSHAGGRLVSNKAQYNVAERIVQGRFGTVTMAAADHLKVMVLDSGDAADNPNLAFLMWDTAQLLRERLEGKIELDLDTARRLFTLICALHITS